ncbi:hypothetical protein I2486_21275 [Cellulophaga sp. E16_2]|uniref:hypothetical protein n=1 Tax=Cellulophaga sp. E16_2 TaxID=2789297 RepID=UPI001A938D91|nr:hypothetical protein [Cellulophaga sp. E16_2]MBO0593939.1 hypothetical protein [Cellulophaga sp. E16_2]
MAVFFVVVVVIIWFTKDFEFLWKFASYALLILALFNLPSLILYLNYYLVNKNTHFELDEILQLITITKNGISKTYQLNECKKSVYHLAYNYKNTIDNRGREPMLLSDFGYWDLEFTNGDKYYLTNILNDFIHDVPKIRNTKYRFRLFPFIKKSNSKEGVKLKVRPKKY